jgi:ABC-type transport system involved in cytochrome c biogenesis permease component
MSPVFIGVITPMVGLVGLSMIDSLSLYFIAPSVLWIAFSMSSVIKFTKKFMVPLWISRSF